MSDVNKRPTKRAKQSSGGGGAASSSDAGYASVVSSEREPELEEERYAREQAARRASGGSSSASSSTASISCPYLDTINTQVLDFDLAQECSVTLEKENVYMCLVCGQLFRGRGKQTPAYTHSAAAGHHVFINLRTA